MKMITTIFGISALIIALVALYIGAINLISTVKMNHYDNMRMKLWPKPEAFEYSAKWFETANWRDKMLPFLPALGFVNHDKSFDAYPRSPKSKKITDNWEGTTINKEPIKQSEQLNATK